MATEVVERVSPGRGHPAQVQLDLDQLRVAGLEQEIERQLAAEILAGANSKLWLWYTNWMPAFLLTAAAWL